MSDETLDMTAAPAPAGPRLNGIQKAAVLLIAVGTKRAAEITKHLDEDDVNLVSVEMAKTQHVAPEAFDSVMGEVVQTAIARGYFHTGGMSYTRDMLTERFGPERAAEIMSRLQAMVEVRPFKFLVRTPPDQIYNFIRREKPQTIALILSHLNEPQAAAVLQQIPEHLQPDIIRRVAQMKATSPELISEIEQVVRSAMLGVGSSDATAVGGVEAAASLINGVDRPTERNIFEVLESSEETAALAEELRNLLFVFEDIVTLEPRAIQVVVRECDMNVLALALRGAPDDVKDVIFSNMTERGAETLREELEIMPKQKRSDVEAAQQQVVGVVRALEEKGEIVISRGGAEDEVV